MRLLPGYRPEVVATIAGEPAGLGWNGKGALIIASRKDKRLLAWDGHKTSVYADLSTYAPFFVNDILVDPTGVSYVSHFGFDLDKALGTYSFSELASGAVPTARLLIVLDKDRSVREAPGDLRFPNGIVCTQGGRLLVTAETFGERLTSFRRDRETGMLDDPDTWLEVPGVAPDGICTDPNGSVWVCNAAANECLQVDAQRRIRCGVRTTQRCFGCCVGGERSEVLYVSTARESLASTASVDETGRIECIQIR